MHNRTPNPLRLSGQSAGQVPEAATTEPRIVTPEEDAERAAREQERQDHAPYRSGGADPLRQPGESSPAPERRG
jgi:hypothetical protein